MNCEELKKQLAALQHQYKELEAQYSSMGSYMGTIADRPSDDARFDRLSDDLNEISDDQDKVRAEIVKIESAMRELGCI